MLTVDQLLFLCDKNRINYSLLKDERFKDKVITNLSEDDRDINLVIGIKKRDYFFEKCILYFKQALVGYSNKRVKIILVEQDNEPYYVNKCKDLGIDYIFVHDSLIGEFYNRSFVYNVAFMLSKKSKWYIFHDIDILVNYDWFFKLDYYIKDGVRWIQPYQKKRVILLDQNQTKEILSNNKIYDLDSISNKIPAKIGSSGGSIVVDREMFITVGGFDADYFTNHGPEDSFFWSKLEVVNNPNINEMLDHFYSGGIFVENIDVFHMYHKYAESSDIGFKNFMLNILHAFWYFKNEDKMKIINKKKQYFIEDLIKLESL